MEYLKIEISLRSLEDLQVDCYIDKLAVMIIHKPLHSLLDM